MRVRLPLASMLLAASVLLAGCTLPGPEESGEPDALPEDATETEDPFPIPEPAPAPTDIAGGDDASPPPVTAPPAPATPTTAEPTPATPTAADPTPAAPPPATTPPPPSPTQPPAAPPPATTPTAPQPGPWPHEGSRVSYTAQQSHGSRFGSSTRTYVNATWTYTDGDWRGVCTANVKTYDPETDSYDEGRTETRTYSAANPPHWPPMNTRSPPALGAEMEAWVFDACDLDTTHTAVYAGTDTEIVGGATVPTHRATHHPAYSNQQLDTEWSRTTGLLIHYDYSWWGSTQSHSLRGRIVSTDAPLS